MAVIGRWPISSAPSSQSMRMVSRPPALRSQTHHNLHMPAKWMLVYSSTLAGCEVSNHVPTAECSSNPTAYRAFAK